MRDAPPRPRVSPCGRFHEDPAGAPLYAPRFDAVLPFHGDGRGGLLAPVQLGREAWHIRPDGSPAYCARWRRCFGFYEGAAAVVAGDGWLHIDPDGRPISAARHAFAGNFQNGRAVVCDQEGGYHHLRPDGAPAYAARWRYCGDFREGAATVQRADGLHGHIDPDGDPAHDRWFDDLDVFHKGCARARDAAGWMHVDRRGVALYAQRYAMVEPFYNGCARVERDDGALLVIDETGETLRMLRPARRSAFAALSADMVGYWRTFAIAAAVELGLPEALPGPLDAVARDVGATPDRLEMLLEALGELGLATCRAGIWTETPRGAALRRDHPHSLADAALEYRGALLAPWRKLTAVLRGAPPQESFFESVVARDDRGAGHHRMLRSYALHDYAALVPLLPIPDGATVFDAAGGDGALAALVAEAHPGAQVTLGDLPGAPAKPGVKRVDFDLFASWPVRADRILLARVLHDWSDARCALILSHAAAALHPGGEILVLEMLRPEAGFDGALCGLHLLVNSRGRERRLSEYEALCAGAGLQVEGVLSEGGLVSCIRVRPKACGY